MFTSKTESTPIQYELDLRPYQWVQQELDLEYLPQPALKEDESSITYDPNTIFTATISDAISSTLQINTAGSERTLSRLIVSPELVIDMPRKQPNALVRFFHKHLLNFTWEKL